jgi:hypothetical protein
MSGEGATEHRCGLCGSRDVNHWKSWNVAGEWVCDECCPDDPEPEGDWL